MHSQRKLEVEEAQKLLISLGRDKVWLYANLSSKEGNPRIGREEYEVSYLVDALSVADSLHVADSNAQTWGCGIKIVMDERAYFLESAIPA